MRLPCSLAALAVAPDRMSQQAVLITNPGHIDPGYEGPLKFTVINMGQSPYVLSAGAVIATLLFFRIDTPAEVGWLAREEGHPGTGVTPEMLSKLSKDFLNFEDRSKRVASRQLGRLGIPGAILTILLSALTVSATTLPFYLSAIDRAHTLQSQVDILQDRVNELASRHSIFLPSPVPSATPSR